mmetsp:Transcript_22370/g.43845  ORF Transcript_22370/g.43845 Transcript_22370/m.43845 type:complete len:594 (+) Transcript_22370:837-2618(+)|eukprot:CAMPEP_0171535238 /NCGR_PEP_ID=MMETSP0959-20130129/16976_1 /TAXON_ID=87120 /ORGANISM="Aurantiochytrium limacinum, Strain ATCCMYA-1381" /LENGTH=593 /DNA_ID=CAMNT_0012081027 /DNA_START=779 /DNA_END=2560 /DNA_ORIENTATION=+
MSVRISPEELGELVQYVPFILQWLRREDSEAGDLFCGAALDADEDEINDLLKSLYDAHMDQGSLGSDELTELLSAVEAAPWARAVHIIFTLAEPRLIEEDQVEELLAALGDGGLTAEEAESGAGPVVQSMEENAREAFYELCVTMHDTCLDSEMTAFALASSLLFREPPSDETRYRARVALSVLVDHVNEVFAKDTEVAPAPVMRAPRAMQNTMTTSDIRIKREQLSAFYEWRDPLCMENVKDLFRNFEFIDIAHGLNNKYGAVPEEWGDELQALADADTPGTEWFDITKATPRPPDLSLLPDINRTRPLSRGGKYFPTKVDQVIDEIIVTEAHYHDMMHDLLDLYVSEISDIAEGRHGPDAQEELGLSAEVIRSCFGSRIENVLEASSTLLARLDLIGLVPLPPFDPVGRPGICARIFGDHAQDLRVYAPYISSHMTAMNDIKEAVARVEHEDRLHASSSARKLIKSGRRKDKRNSFVKIWFEKSQISNRLRGQTLESALMGPVQRVPRYRLLLETLLKEVPKIDPNHPSLPLIEDALEKIKIAAVQINTAVKQHMKLQSMFGKDHMISPNSSIARKDGEGNFLAIVNSYVG